LYLKAHYPLAYLTACINNFGGYYRTEIYVHEARRFGAQIEAPCINEGAYSCVLKEKRLILGFNLVAGIEVVLAEQILIERSQNGVFTSLENLLKRIYIPLEQLSILIRIGALRSFEQPRKALLWQAHFYHNKQLRPQPKQELFEVKQHTQHLPELEEHPLEITFEQFELLGFPLCDPFSLLAQPLPSFFILANDFPKYVNQHINTFGYLVSIKQTKTNKGDTMCFGTFLDPSGDFLDTVHFPQITALYPFYGKGVYRITGKITEEFSYFTLEVTTLEKLAFAEDVRLAL
jgi:DNA polymerase-3 subunit alpha